MRAALVFPRFRYPSGDFGIGLASIGAVLRRDLPHVELALFDTTHRPSHADLDARLAAFAPQICLLYSDTLMFADALRVADACRRLGAHVIAGGPHPTVRPEQTIASGRFDAICIGEGERTASEYVRTFFAGGDLSRVAGTWSRGPRGVVRNEGRPPIDDLDALPFPAVDLYDMPRYLNDFSQLDSFRRGVRGVSVIASRGCPHGCSFCQPTLRRLFGPRVRLRGPENVAAELAALREAYGIEGFYLQDDTITAFPEWVKRFCEALRAAGLGLPWACNTRADSVEKETLRTMRDAGLVKIKVGIEAASARVRNGVYRKGLEGMRLDSFLADCHTLGIQTAGFFMLGAPTETPREVWETIRLAVRSGLAEANFSVATPLPGTDLERFVAERGWPLPVESSEFDYYQARRPRMDPEEIGLRHLACAKHAANLLFYLHPKRLRSTARQIAPRTIAMKLRRL
jgi:radical SAM superfamily enzyme YgiQ (UPF0313 family)